MSVQIIRGNALDLPLADPRLTGSRLDSILDRLVMAESGCWEWTGARSPLGYGRVGYGPRRYGTANVHRVVYEALIGLVPSGLELDHLCRNPPCANPDHLEPVTHGENVRRGRAAEQIAARNRSVTSCPRNHPYDENNTYVDAKGCRGCKECRREATRQWRVRNR